MQVATLTATLEANVASFMANLRGADRQAEDMRQKLVELVVASRTASAALDNVKLDPAQTQATKAYAAEMKKAVDGVTVSAELAGREIHDMNLQKTQVMKFIAGSETMKKELKDIRNDALAATVALDGLEIQEDVTGRRGTRGQFLPGRTFVGASPIASSYVKGVTPTSEELLTRWEDVVRRMPLALPEHAGGGIPMGKATGDDFGESFVRAIAAHYPPVTQYEDPMATRPMTREEWLSLYNSPEYKRLIGGDDLKEIGRILGTMGINEQSAASDLGIIKDQVTKQYRLLQESEQTQSLLVSKPGDARPDVRGAEAFLRSRGIPTSGEFTSVRGGVGGASKRGDVQDALTTAAALGWSGRGSHWQRMGFGGRGFGWGIPVPPHARFGTPLALAGFGLDRIIASSLGILGSFGGGVLGGGILGAGALGTMAVGGGTNLAGMGQAAGDISLVTKDLNNLQTAIQQYGKNSTQAADAQLQLNTDLKSFSPVARNAVLAASQTAQGFKAMFDKLTGPAEKIGAQIIQQAMMVGEKFLPTIGKFARQNMGILQRGLQPFFGWLTKGGNAQNVIKDVNNLNKAIKEHGANSAQAAQANQQLNKDNRHTGGLAYFQDLEKVFQKHFPTAIHAGEQGFELLMKTIDLAAQHLGHFLKTLDHFLTKMNNQDFGKWATGVEHLIGLFHSWLGMFIAFGKVIVSVFKPAVGFGQAFANTLTQVFNQINKYLNQKGTQNILHQLFSAHLVQMIHQIGGLLMNLLPIAESVVSAWLQIEIVAVKAFGVVINVLKSLFGWFNKIPHADKIAGWAIALFTIVKVNRLLLGGILPLLRAIPFIGVLFGTAAGEAEGAVGTITASIEGAAGMITEAFSGAIVQVENLIRAILGIGPAAATSSAEADAAISSIGGAADVSAAQLSLLDAAEVSVGPAAVAASAEADAAIAGIGLASIGIVPQIAVLLGALAAAYYIYKKLSDQLGSQSSDPLGGVSHKFLKHHKKAYARYLQYVYGNEEEVNGKLVPMPGHHIKAFKEWYQQHYGKPVSGPGSSSYENKMQQQMDKEIKRMEKKYGVPTHYQHGGSPPGSKPTTPTGYLDKQQAETARARIDIAKGHYAAALKMLKLEDKQLHDMLKMAKNQAERTAIMDQMATVADMIKQAKHHSGVTSTTKTFQLPMALQVAMAKADALAALNPNLQGPTSQQYQLALKAKKIAMKAINSHNLSMQQLIQAWGIVSQANAVIAQRMGVYANTYHKVSTDAITDAVKGLTRSQEMQLRERLAQSDAHRGYAPNQSAVGGGGATVASPHHKHHHHHHDGGGGGGGRSRTLSSTHQGGTTIHIDKVEIHGVQNVRQLAAEIDKLARQKHQRAGGRR